MPLLPPLGDAGFQREVEVLELLLGAQVAVGLVRLARLLHGPLFTSTPSSTLQPLAGFGSISFQPSRSLPLKSVIGSPNFDLRQVGRGRQRRSALAGEAGLAERPCRRPGLRSVVSFISSPRHRGRDGFGLRTVVAASCRRRAFRAALS